MGAQRRAIGPALDENQALRVLRILAHLVRDTAGLGARAPHVLQAQAQRFRKLPVLQDHAADDENHGRILLVQGRAAELLALLKRDDRDAFDAKLRIFQGYP